MQSYIHRLNRALTEAERLLNAFTNEHNSSTIKKQHERDLIKYIRRLGFLLSTVKLYLNRVNTIHDEKIITLVHRTEVFLSFFLSQYIPNSNFPISCVGVLCDSCQPKPPFAHKEYFLVHKDISGETISTSLLDCPYYVDEPSTNISSISTKTTNSTKSTKSLLTSSSLYKEVNSTPKRSPSIVNMGTPITSDASTLAYEKVMDDIKSAIHGMKEGVTRMSDFMQQERASLDANAMLLQRGVDGTMIQCKSIDQLGFAFGGGPALPRFLHGIPGAGMMWDMFIVPFYAMVRQALFICVIVAVTGGVLLLMLTAPKTYAYAR